MHRKAQCILVADDDPVYREIACDELVRAGHAVMSAADGGTACRLLETETFDAAIIDLNMPVACGLTVIRKLRAGARNATMPVIVITGHDDQEAVSNAYDAGATSFLVKPLNWILFTPHVEFVLRSGQTESELREAHAAAAFLSDLKSQVMTALASEFHAPIKSIFGFSQLISKEVYGQLQPVPYREMVEDMGKSAHRLNASLLKLLDFGKSLTDQLEMKDETISAWDAIRHAITAADFKAHRRDVSLTADLAIPPDLKIKADRALLSQALRGILDNAIRMSPRGASVKVRASLDDTGRLVVAAHDQGPPIAPELIAEIMAHTRGRPVVQPTEARDVSIKIARVLAEAHQGSMDIGIDDAGANVVRIELPAQRVMDNIGRSVMSKLSAISDALAVDPHLISIRQQNAEMQRAAETSNRSPPRRT